MSDDQSSHKITNYFNKIFKQKNNEDVRETIEDLIEEASCNGEDEFSEHEQELLSNMLYIGDRKVCRVMIPRADIIAFQKNGTVEELATLMVEKGHSRIPVYGDSLDDIVGMLHMRDVAQKLLKGEHKESIANVQLNPIKMITPDDLVLDILQQMQLNKNQMAIVMDEYGGLCGLLTIEDLLEEIVGDIEDEYDLEEEYIVNLQENGLYVADAKADLEDVEEVTGVKFFKDSEEEEESEVDTLGGYIFKLAQRIPSKGEIIKDINGVGFKILEVSPSRIEKVMIIIYSEMDKVENTNDKIS